MRGWRGRVLRGRFALCVTRNSTNTLGFASLPYGEPYFGVEENNDLLLTAVLSPPGLGSVVHRSGLHLFVTCISFILCSTLPLSAVSDLESPCGSRGWVCNLSSHGLPTPFLHA